MKNPWPHRCALLLALLVFLLIATGASLTSLIRPLPGSPAATKVNVPTNVPTEVTARLDQIHKILAAVVAILVLALAIFIPIARVPICIAAALVVIDSGLGVYSAAGVLHALFAPLLFSAAVVIAVFTSKSWAMPPVPAENPWPPLRQLAIWTPLLLMAQIALGAAFRHNAMGVVWHILNAMIVLMLILVLGICVLRLYPKHPALRPAALALLMITGVQVLLGFAVYITLLMVSENNMALMAAGAIHVLTGSLTLAASVVLTIQLRKNSC